MKSRTRLFFILVLVLILSLFSLLLYVLIKPNNFISIFLEDRFNFSLTEFLLRYVLSLIIYFALALLLLFLWNSFLRALTDKLSSTTVNTFRVLGRMLIIPFFVVAYLNQIPAFRGTLLGLSALIGTAIGFSSTKTIGNFVSGLYLIFSKPFEIHDYVILPDFGVEGIIREVTINHTKIDKPEGNTAIVSNSKLIDANVINIRLTEEKRQSFKDYIPFYGKKDQNKVYVYPLTWSSDGDDSHESCVQAIIQTEKQFKDAVVAPIQWFILKRERLNRVYQINLTVEDPYTLLSLTGDFMNALESNFEKVRKKVS